MPATRGGAAGEIVILIAGIGVGMVQNSGDEADFLGRLHREEGGGGAAEVVWRHGLAEGALGAAADGLMDGTRAKRVAALPHPKGVVGVATHQDRSNLVQVVPQ